MPIESGMLTRSLEGQKKVETYYDIRKQVFDIGLNWCWMAVP